MGEGNRDDGAKDRHEDKPHWGASLDGLSPDRKNELRLRLYEWTPEQATEDKPGPFAHRRLNGLEVFWLAVCALASPQSGGRFGHDVWSFDNFQPDEAALTAAERRLREATGQFLASVELSLSTLLLQGANLEWAQLQGANLSFAQLQGANLAGTQLQGAFLSQAQLQGAYLGWAQLQGAILSRARLNGADLSQAQLQEAVLDGAQLEGANLREAKLEGANLRRAQLQGANLRATQLNAETRLNEAQLTGNLSWRSRLLRRCWPFWETDAVALGDVRWNGVGTVDLTQVADWEQVQRLGDERYVTWRSRLQAHLRVARAYRQVGTQLRAQGMNSIADRFTYRALVFERRAALRRRRFVQYLGSLLLAALAGYGYRPGRTLLWYLLTIALFAATFHAYGSGCAVMAPFDVLHLALAHPPAPLVAAFHLSSASAPLACSSSPMSWHESLVISLTAFHGRGFYTSAFQPGDPQAGIAAAEAVIGLIIEVSFIATFTQRFFGSK